MTTIYPFITTAADLLHSTIRLPELASFLQKNDVQKAAIINRSLYGILPFYETMIKASIEPIIGLSIQVEVEENELDLHLYAEDELGYKQLLKLSSARETREIDAIPLKWLIGYQSGLRIVIPFSPTKTKEELDVWIHTLHVIREKIQVPLAVGIIRLEGVASAFEDDVEQFCHQSNIIITAHYESYYLHQEDAFGYEVARNIAGGTKLSDETRYELPHRSHFVPSAENWTKWYRDKPEWILGATRFFDACHVVLDLSSKHMPKFPLATTHSSADLLWELCQNGLQKLVENPSTIYHTRLKHEFTIITSMGFEDYFLIVADFMDFARKNHILTGPGRGSSAGSLIAYCLYITQVDPIQHGLLFERFLNPERVTLPDIDIDFLDHRRNEVISYVAKKYGQDYVAQIMTYGTLSAKAVARDVGRVFHFDGSILERISSFIPSRVGITLAEARKENANFDKWIASDDMHEKWWEACLQLEGLPKHVSTHAAGVVLSPKPLVEYVPIQKGQDTIYLTQWPMKEVEQSGLLKMDFLGLRNLSLLERIRYLIYADQKKWMKFDEIPFDDAKTLTMLQQGDTLGVFQLESEGMRKTLREVMPTSFSDIVAINALFRPGPMENIPLFARRKKGLEKVHYQHPLLEPILKETYGIIVYQEQIMQIAAQIAGFSYGQADLLRRAVSKKNRQLLEEQRAAFSHGAMNNGIQENVANELFQLIVRFADYGFPKSHAVAYSVISFQLAYFKANYPAYFYGALLASVSGNADKIAEIQLEMNRYDVELLGPSIFKSDYSFRVESGKIRYGLQSIKGVSTNFAQLLLSVRKERENPWQDLFDLAVSLSASQFSRKLIEPFIYAGALDDFGKDRSVLLATLDAAVKYAELVRPNMETDLFSGSVQSFGKPKYVKASDMPKSKKLQFEKETLGIYISSHPVVEWKSMQQKEFPTIYETTKLPVGKVVSIAGMILEVKSIRTKKGESMCFFHLQDESGDISVTMFPKEYANLSKFIQSGEIIEVRGKLDQRQGALQLIVQNIENQ
ncbi:DNA polymerase III subunit alpha [Paenisporosarcina cavernae]|uniref:DNA-directed DNA polymerase n=1 Tax=Paenisporosarcina cavernae TaxID=2320858 RepID=A0A385YSP5_9BACL|nr:exodeoxyribonuclease VII large subunit [Paenisporosarcina cavernae]AYC29839.1 DNA polymerase III subunit alpha [Paenisporosarcina cavernae]